MARSFNWQGIEWIARRSNELEGPGPNKWSSNNVTVDDDGHLHLRISQQNGQWTCAEVFTSQKFGFGRYVWSVEGAVDKLDPKLVLGLFTYPTPAEGPDRTNEIDIEWSKWGQTDQNATNLGYTIYPRTEGGPIVSKNKKQGLNGTYTTSAFTWSPNGVKLESYHGHTTKDENKFFEWTTPYGFANACPIAPVPIHMNLWIHQEEIPGMSPLNGEEVEVIIHNFKFTLQ
ncbi:unnamed protein product [Adineta ricciae]|uniref:GH16 domain-containing protein n=1 Tax=Adineta ricciae TaxID=249248 RepID=A0A815SSB6_ADIRI|nr:unnamed protein product [Adineta ricciae]CAF1647097.1 unnamed protein product [Adineta ricciae]